MCRSSRRSGPSGCRRRSGANEFRTLRRNSNGVEGWVVDGRSCSIWTASPIAARRWRIGRKNPQRWADVPAAVYDPKERLKAMDEPASIMRCFTRPSPAIGRTIVRADGRSGVGARLRAGLQRLAARRMGRVRASALFRSASYRSVRIDVGGERDSPLCGQGSSSGVIYPSVPMELRDVPHINDSVYDPIWATCQELDVPICFHAGASRQIQIPAYEGYSPALAAAVQSITRPASSVSVLVNLLISKILMRFPRLKVVLAESGLGWGAYLAGVHRFSSHWRPVAAKRLRSHAVGVVQTPVLSGGLVRSRQFARAPLHWYGKYSLVEPVSFGDVHLAEYQRSFGAEFRWSGRKR